MGGVAIRRGAIGRFFATYGGRGGGRYGDRFFTVGVWGVGLGGPTLRAGFGASYSEVRRYRRDADAPQGGRDARTPHPRASASISVHPQSSAFISGSPDVREFRHMGGFAVILPGSDWPVELNFARGRGAA